MSASLETRAPLRSRWRGQSRGAAPRITCMDSMHPLHWSNSSLKYLAHEAVLSKHPPSESAVMTTNFYPHQIYADSMEVVGMGQPLWVPEHVEILIGDVGFIVEGRFHRLFNAMYPADHKINGNKVPRGFKMLQLNEKEFRVATPHYLQPGPICAKSVTQVKASPGLSVPAVNAQVSYSFSCNGKRGATAILSGYGSEEKYLRNRQFRKYMHDHHEAWYEFYQDMGHESVPDTGIVLVSGRITTESNWALTAFGSAGKSHSFSFSAPLGSSVNGNFEFALKESHSLNTLSRSRPKPQNPGRHCLFVRYYKIKKGILHRRAVGEVPRAPEAVSDPDDVSCPIPLCCIPLPSVFRKKPDPPAHALASSRAARPRGGASGVSSWGMAERLRGGSGRQYGSDRWSTAPGPGRDTSANSRHPHAQYQPLTALQRYKATDALDQLLDYMLEESDDNIAITSHDDLYAICPPRTTDLADFTNLRSYLEQRNVKVNSDEHGARIFQYYERPADDPINREVLRRLSRSTSSLSLSTGGPPSPPPPPPQSRPSQRPPLLSSGSSSSSSSRRSETPSPYDRRSMDADGAPRSQTYGRSRGDIWEREPYNVSRSSPTHYDHLSRSDRMLSSQRSQNMSSDMSFRVPEWVNERMSRGQEVRLSRSGRPYFLDLHTGAESWVWNGNRTVADASLPADWEIRFTSSDRPYYINHGTRSTTIFHPQEWRNILVAMGPQSNQTMTEMPPFIRDLAVFFQIAGEVYRFVQALDNAARYL